MGANTSIQWTNATVNFWMGCKKVSPGCKYCYMFRDQIKFGRDPENIVRTSPKTPDGRLLLMALSMISTESRRDQQPDEILAAVNKLADEVDESNRKNMDECMAGCVVPLPDMSVCRETPPGMPE